MKPANMKPIAILGVLLIAIGIAGLIITNISFTEKTVIVDAGPLKVTADQQRSIPIPSIAGVIAIVAGAGLLLYGRRARS
jgi:nitrate reductase gamma subunit